MDFQGSLLVVNRRPHVVDEIEPDKLDAKEAILTSLLSLILEIILFFIDF